MVISYLYSVIVCCIHSDLASFAMVLATNRLPVGNPQLIHSCRLCWELSTVCMVSTALPVICTSTSVVSTAAATSEAFASTCGGFSFSMG